MFEESYMIKIDNSKESIMVRSCSWKSLYDGCIFLVKFRRLTGRVHWVQELKVFCDLKDLTDERLYVDDVTVNACNIMTYHLRQLFDVVEGRTASAGINQPRIFSTIDEVIYKSMQSLTYYATESSQTWYKNPLNSLTREADDSSSWIVIIICFINQ